MGGWPRVVWEAAVMRGLDARAQREIEQAGRLVERAEGGAIYDEGAQGDAFFVVARGRVRLTGTPRGEATARELRMVPAGGSFGEEATVGSARRSAARAEPGTLVAEVPVHLFRRAAARAGTAELAERLERSLRRAATRELLRTSALGVALEPSSSEAPDDGELERLLETATMRQVASGEPVFREGERATHAYLVASGLVQVQVDDGERVHVRGYVTRGDLLGEAELLERSPRAFTAVANGPVSLVCLAASEVRAVFGRNPGLAERLSRIARSEEARQASLAKGALSRTQHALRDLYRMQVARSLLVLDLDTCIRCGHCSVACASLHGTSRLARQGEIILVRDGDGATGRAGEGGQGLPRSLLLPSSCQHCEEPACMIDCPTGAIGKDPEGEVFIREELCTGCGACVKACPWDNVELAPRPAEAPRPRGGAFPLVAVKCDLCAGYDGAACVRACPVEALARVDPKEELDDVRALLGGPTRPTRERRTIAPSSFALAGFVLGASLGAAGALAHQRGLWSPSTGPGLAAGVGAALGMVALAGYSLPKRVSRLWVAKRPRERASSERTSRVRPHLVAHVALGLVTLGLALAHAPRISSRGRPPLSTSGSALLVALGLASGLGLVAVALHRVLPRRLARLERRGGLPESHELERAELRSRLFREASGKSELVKGLLERALLPYARAWLGPVALVLSGRSLAEERRAVRARIDDRLEGRGGERLAGLDALVRVVVELRALPAVRALTLALRATALLHLVPAALALALLVVHALTAVLR
jgi:Fe-S-cluster-containing dehydrogenase component